MKRFILYAIRWQLSTPILLIVLSSVEGDYLFKTILANLIGAIVFYGIDKKIMI